MSAALNLAVAPDVVDHALIEEAFAVIRAAIQQEDHDAIATGIVSLVAWALSRAPDHPARRAVLIALNDALAAGDVRATKLQTGHVVVGCSPAVEQLLGALLDGGYGQPASTRALAGALQSRTATLPQPFEQGLNVVIDCEQWPERATTAGWQPDWQAKATLEGWRDEEAVEAAVETAVSKARDAFTEAAQAAEDAARAEGAK